MSDFIILYCDGASRNNPGQSGWGVYLKYKQYEKRLNGYVQHATNNQMELMAVIKGLEAVKDSNVPIHVYTDSNLVKRGMNEWLKNWKAKGWKTASRKPVKNVEMWKELDKLNQKYKVEYHWVKAHASDPLNNLVDRLANKAIDAKGSTE